MIKEFNKDGRQIDETVDDATSFMDDWQKKGGKIDGIYIVIDCHDMLQAFSSRMRLDTRVFMLESAKHSLLSEKVDP